MDTNTFDLEDNRDSWSEEECIKLIHAYRQHPVLYDPKDPYFYKRYAKISAWNSVGAALQRPPRECKHKMSILLSSFRRQKSKFRKGNMTVSRWFGYKHLKFLLLINKEEHSMHRILSHDSDDARSVISTDDCYEGQSGDTETQENNGIETVIVTETDFIKMENKSDADDDIEPNSEKDPSLLRNILTETAQTEITHQKENPAPSTNHRQIVPKKNILKEDEINAFTKFVNIKMKKYSSKTVTAIQQEICEILFRADHELYEKSRAYNLNP